jgi:hypothetical protein
MAQFLSFFKAPLAESRVQPMVRMRHDLRDLRVAPHFRPNHQEYLDDYP